MNVLHKLMSQLSEAAVQALAQVRTHSIVDGATEPGRHGSAPASGEGPDRVGSGPWSSAHQVSLGGREARAVFGYTLRMGLDGVSAEPFGDVPQPPLRRPGPPSDESPLPGQSGSAAFAARQPIVDVFEEADGIVVIAELPGADRAGLVCRSDGRTLLIETSGPRRYRKEIALPDAVEIGDVSPRFQNGILEVRLARVAAP